MGEMKMMSDVELKVYWKELKAELDEIRKEQDYWNMKFRNTQEELWRIEELLCVGDEYEGD